MDKKNYMSESTTQLTRVFGVITTQGNKEHGDTEALGEE